MDDIQKRLKENKAWLDSRTLLNGRPNLTYSCLKGADLKGADLNNTVVKQGHKRLKS